VKFRLFVGLAAGIAVCASSVSAQVCQGDLSFRSRSKHVGGAIALGENSTSFGAGLTAGHAQGWFAGGSVAMVDFDNINSNAVAVNGGLGYSMPLVKKSKWQLCPGGTLSLGFGPSFDTGAGTMKLSSQTITMGASVGTSVPMTKSVSLLPFGSASIAHTRLSAKLDGNSNSESETYLLLGAGAGIQLSPSLVFRPSLLLAAGADLVDDTVFSLGLTWALPR
jgi:outer membrane autotransporter protein